jgi:hypothetical protein
MMVPPSSLSGPDVTLGNPVGVACMNNNRPGASCVGNNPLGASVMENVIGLVGLFLVILTVVSTVSPAIMGIGRSIWRWVEQISQNDADMYLTWPGKHAFKH